MLQPCTITFGLRFGSFKTYSEATGCDSALLSGTAPLVTAADVNQELHQASHQGANISLGVILLSARKPLIDTREESIVRVDNKELKEPFWCAAPS